MTLPNGMQTTYSYDPASQVTNILHQLTATSTQINQAAYAYNPVGNRTSLTDRRGSQAFGYDTLDRLTSASHPLLATPQAFAYDPVGNRTTGGTVVNAGNQLTADANFGYQYDDNGNLTRKTLLATGNYSQYTYDAENRLTKVEDFVAGNPTAFATSTYRYDGLGRRIEKVANGQTKRYIYDGEDILLEYDGANVLQARYTHGPGIDEPIAVTKGGNTFFYHQDGLGTVTDLTDNAGATAKSYSYDAYGNLVDQTGTLDQPYTYTGREFDSESGLYYLRARSFDPIAGRFFQKDPIGLRGGLNLYRYAFDNPVRFTDPRGTDVWAGLEGSGIVMAGIGGFQGGGGVMGNITTGEMCVFTLTCGRVGLGLILGAGGKGFGQLFAPRCGKDVGGWSVALAGDIIVPGFSGFGGSVGGGGALGVGAAVGPDVGAGIAAGVDVCYVKIQSCVNTPPDCQDCAKSK
jgi:RHS repeat-associated protein